MPNLLDLLMGTRGGWAPDVQQTGVRPDYGLGTMTGLGALTKSPYERTLRPGEMRTGEDLRSMLAEVILAGAAGASPLTGLSGRQSARQALSTRSRGQLYGLKGNGAEVVGYDWRSKVEDVHSERGGGLVAKRVSDWDRKGISTGTGRDIVHVFKVRHPDGSITEEGINSAQNILGISEGVLRGLALKERKNREESVRETAFRESMAAQQAASASWERFLAERGQGPDMSSQIQSLGGFAAARALFKMAQTGRE